MKSRLWYHLEGRTFLLWLKSLCPGTYYSLRHPRRVTSRWREQFVPLMLFPDITAYKNKERKTILPARAPSLVEHWKKRKSSTPWSLQTPFIWITSQTFVFTSRSGPPVCLFDLWCAMLGIASDPEVLQQGYFWAGSIFAVRVDVQHAMHKWHGQLGVWSIFVR